MVSIIPIYKVSHHPWSLPVRWTRYYDFTPYKEKEKEKDYLCDIF